MNKCIYCGTACKKQFCNNSCSAKYNNIKRCNPTFIKCSCCGVVLTSSAMKISDGYCSAQCLVEHETSQQSQLPIFHHSKQKGDIGEMVVVTEALKRGYTVCTTVGDNARYDIIIDDGDLLMRVQVKAITPDDETLIVPFGTVTYDRESQKMGMRHRPYSSNEIDCIMAVSLLDYSIYCISSSIIDETAGGTLHLRLSPPQNNQRVGVNWAHRYLW